MLWITAADYRNDFKINLTFSDGKSGIVDFENLLDEKIFLPLKNPGEFKNFRLNSWTLEWENGADFSPEFLYSKMIENH
ncbi:Protein of unknown function [Cruoricaptor ignavus]|uniref:DUF2442 domain-containing protein n=1 Tax=Cruoricaptor ignavus TaxID=1118202 RepID=A0A1M6CCA4_9FLAO|nr:DUF2442 domain-containing protein [Cruoricaptor ignavus]SHI58642.1 Protein of unknown function [Cruoricaptor ignavus]